MTRRVVAALLAGMVLTGCGGRKADPPAALSEQLPTIVTNLDSSGSYVSASITVSLLGGAREWTARLPAVEAAALSVLRGETPADLAGSGGQLTLAHALQAAIKPLLPTMQQVYVTKLVVD